MTRHSRVGGKRDKQPMGKSSGGNRVRGKKLMPEAERKVGGESSGGGSSWGKNKRVFPPPPAKKTSLPPRLGLKESGTYEEFIRNALARTRARRCNPYIGFEPFGGEKMADESTIERYLEQIEESDGFDIDVFPGGPEAIYVPIRNFKNDPQLYKDLVEMAIMALKEFNDKNKDTKGVPFGFKDIEKVTSYMCAGEVFHITFQAEEAETAELKTFQAKVYERIWEDQRMVMLVRLKKNTRLMIVLDDTSTDCSVPLCINAFTCGVSV